MWRNPLTLFRGAEYQRFTAAAGKEPLTYYDMNLSAQDHQTFFTSEYDTGKPEYDSEYDRGLVVPTMLLICTALLECVSLWLFQLNMICLSTGI